MSLTHDDLVQIRNIIVPIIAPVDGEIKALRNDVKEIYDTLHGLRRDVKRVETKVDKINTKVTANEADIKELYHLVAA